MKSYAEFKAAMRTREGSGRYCVANVWGFLGAYQFGMARLCDLGLTRRIDPCSKGMGNNLFEFIPPLTEDAFLRSRTIQDGAFDEHVRRLKAECVKLGATENLSGAIAGAHLLGIGGLRNYIEIRLDGTDANGTHISSYYEKFRGYEIP